MWKIWKEEVYKIASRRIVWWGIILLLAFLSYRLFSIVKYEYTSTIDGKTYVGTEAIEMDKKLTSQYAGTLTKEKVMEIYDRFGFYSFDSETEEYERNYSNQFITKRFTDYMQTSESDPNKLQFYQGEEWERNAAPLLDAKIQFDYAYGWEDLQETYGITTIWALFIVLIISLSSIFSEEYTQKTAPMLLTTKRGKQSVIWLKAAAAIFFSTMIFCVVTLYLWGIYGMVFGTQGLDASPEIFNIGVGYQPATIGGFFLLVFGLGLLGTLFLSGMVFAISACCRSPFLTVILSVSLFLVPILWVKIFAPMWLFGPTITKIVNHVMVSMPVYLPMNWGFSFSRGEILMHIMIGLAIWIMCMQIGYHRFKNYQG